MSKSSYMAFMSAYVFYVSLFIVLDYFVSGAVNMPGYDVEDG